MSDERSQIEKDIDSAAGIVGGAIVGMVLAPVAGLNGALRAVDEDRGVLSVVGRFAVDTVTSPAVFAVRGGKKGLSRLLSRK